MRTKQSILHLQPTIAGKRQAAKPGSLRLLAMVAAAIMLAGLLSGCGGSSGSGTGTVSALTLPSRVQLASAEDSSSSSSAASVRVFSASAARAYDDAGTDYSNEESRVWVDDTNALDMVNDILGVLKDTAYAQFLNQGPYLALVRQVGDEQTSQTGNAGTSTTTEQLMEIVVDVSREDNNSPMIAKIWVNEDDGPGDQPMLIKGYFQVWAGAGDTYQGVYYPYGKLEAHFKGLNSAGAEMFHMAMSIGDGGDGKIRIQYVEDCDETGFEFHNHVNAIASSDMSTGNAYVYTAETDWDSGALDEETLYIAYNDDYFKVQDAEDGTVTAFSRAVDDMTYRVYRYKLFDATDGSAVELTSGFPIRIENGDTTYHAYVGYYGLWAPEEAEVENGTEVTREGSDATYTVIQKAGKLKKHVKTTIPLSKLDGIEMSKWDDTNNQDIVLTYDKDTNKFVQIGVRSQDTNWQVVETGAGTEITFSEWEGAWCDSLQAWLPLGSLGSGFTSTTTLTYHQETTVMPGSDDFPTADLTLKYWDFTANGGTGAWVTYTYDVSEMMLKDSSGNNVVSSSNEFYMPLVLESDYDADADGNENGAGIQSDPGDAFTLNTFYSWSTGSEQWNQLTLLQDADGNYVTFDAPLKFTYEHLTSYDLNDDATYNEKTFTLEYDGFSLQVPWAYDAAEDEWCPLINLKDSADGGPTLEDSDGNLYVVKAVEAGLIMSEVSDTSVADDLEIDTSVAEPDLEYDATKTALVGDKPTDVELEVIKGELVE